MTKEQLAAREFVQLATVHARDGGNVTQALVDGMTPENRAALHKLAGDLAARLEPPDAADNGNREHVETGIATSPTAIAEQAEHKGVEDDEEEEVARAKRLAAADAMPGLGRIGR